MRKFCACGNSETACIVIYFELRVTNLCTARAVRKHFYDEKKANYGIHVYTHKLLHELEMRFQSTQRSLTIECMYMLNASTHTHTHTRNSLQTFLAIQYVLEGKNGPRSGSQSKF